MPAKPLDYRAMAEKQIAAARALTDALFHYMTLDCQAILEQPVPEPMRSYRPTVEDLVRQTKTVEALETQIHDLEESLKPNEIPEAQRAVIRAAIKGPLEGQLAQQQEYLSMLQRSMEQAEKDDIQA